MPPAPSVVSKSGAAARAPGASINTGTAFLIGRTATGTPLEPKLITSPGQHLDVFGVRDEDTAPLVDAVYDGFRTGLARAYVVPVEDETDAAEVTAALAALPGRLGPGQVYAPGAQSQAAQIAVAQHAAAHNRTAVVQLADGTSSAQAAAAVGLRTAIVSDEVVGAFGTWLEVPGYTAGTRRTAPLANFALGLMSRVDGRYGNSHHAAAGDQGWGAGLIRDALAVPRTYSETDRETLHTAGVNIAFEQPSGGIELYDFVSLSEDEQWRQLDAHRARMGVVANHVAMLRPFLFCKLTNELKREIIDTLSADWLALYNAGVLYGDTADDAFEVTVPDELNPPAAIAAGQLKVAESYVRASHLSYLENIITAEGIA